MNLLLDKASARRTDEQGFLHVDGCNISKATVNPYRGSEIPDHEALGLDPARIYYVLRPAEELEKAAATFNNLPLLDTHVEVSTEDFQDPAIHKHVVGSTGTDAVFNAPYLQNSLVIWTAGAVAGVDSKEQTELSCAYRYKLDMQPGEFEGQHYDFSMKDIVGNHVALVREGRAGKDVVVKDSAMDSEATSVMEQLAAIKEEITKKLKPGVEGDAAEILDDLTGAIDVAIHHLVDYEEKTVGSITAEDDNPEGINQYTGGGGSSKADSMSSKAKEVHAEATRNGGKQAYLKAAEAHNKAGKEHLKEYERHANSGNGKQASYHLAQHDAHKDAINRIIERSRAGFSHDSTRAVFSHDSITEDDNPEGINQYTGGGSSVDPRVENYVTRMKAAFAEKPSASKSVREFKSKERSKQAEKMSKSAKTVTQHLAAENFHKLAEKAASEAGNREKADYHRGRADFHVGAQERKGDSITADIAEREDINPKVGEQKYGEVKFADAKNKKYPIDTREHATSALAYWGHAKNKDKYSKEDQEEITKRINAAAKQFKIGSFAADHRANADSKEGHMANTARKLTPRGLAVKAVLAEHLRHKLAADAALQTGELDQLLKKITPAKFGVQKTGIVGTVIEQFTSRLAKDAKLDKGELEEMLEKLEEEGDEGDEDDDEDEFSEDAKKTAKDEEDDDLAEDDENGPGKKLMAIIGKYGDKISEEDLTAINDCINAIGSKTAEDQFPNIKKGAAMPKPPLDKPAMDAALEGERARLKALVQAGEDVKPFVGTVNVLSMDSADQVYKLALDARKVNAEGIEPSAYRAMVRMLNVEQPVTKPTVQVGADSATITTFEEKYPHAKNIKRGY